MVCLMVHYNTGGLLPQNHLPVLGSQIHLYEDHHVVYLQCVLILFEIHHLVLVHHPMGSWMQNVEEIDGYFLELPFRIAYPIVDIEVVLSRSTVQRKNRVDTVWQYQPYFLFLWQSNERIVDETVQSVLLLVLYRKLLTGLET